MEQIIYYLSITLILFDGDYLYSITFNNPRIYYIT